MYSDFERDGESSSFHSYLSYSLYKPYKSVLRKLLLDELVPFSLNAGGESNAKMHLVLTPVVFA